MAPEGAIVDPGVEKDAEYVQQCSKFMLDHDRRPLKYLLTPRYKGMQLVTTHNPEGIFSVTMAFVCRDKDSVQVDDLTGAAEGAACAPDRWTTGPRHPRPPHHFEAASTSSRTSSRYWREDGNDDRRAGDTH